MMSNYDASLTRVLRDEGGYTNHPSDPGGPTNFGITLNDARRYWKGNATADDVRAMPQTVARKIYRERYWNTLRCDELPSGIDYALFDYGVNSGIGRAGKVLRRVMKLADTSSAVTDDVVAVVVKANAGVVVQSICAERLAFLKSLKTFPVFGRGWVARVNGVQAAALMMAAHRAPADLALNRANTPQAKAVVAKKIRRRRPLQAPSLRQGPPPGRHHVSRSCCLSWVAPPLLLPVFFSSRAGGIAHGKRPRFS